jgi:hypothetical protein
VQGAFGVEKNEVRRRSSRGVGYVEAYRMNTYYHQLLEFIEQQPVVNTHCHHRKSDEFQNFSLGRLIENSYVGWCNAEPGTTREERRLFLHRVRNRSYFVWLQRSLQELYGFEDTLTADNWDEWSRTLKNAHQNPDSHIMVLKQRCRYNKIILDAYWDPGSDNGLPDLFVPTYRINMYLYGYNRLSEDHNGNNPQRIYDRNITDIDSYIDFMREIVVKKKDAGCVALKSALAYDRSIDFHSVPKADARRVFEKNDSKITAEEIRDFQDFIFFELCAIAGDLNIPFQCHTGLGEIDRTNAMQMREAIVKHPDTTFVLFHGSYPWLDDLCALMHRYPNVYADLCWLPIISPSAAKRLLHEILEVGNGDRIVWGCDTWTSEESYGSLLAFRSVFAETLSEKVESGYFDIEEARRLAVNVLSRNAMDLYGITLS